MPPSRTSGAPGDHSEPAEPTRAERAMGSYNEGLEAISKRLQEGLARGDEAAVDWAQVLHLALDVQQDYMERETALRAFYVALYGASRKNKLPRVPGPLHALARANPAGSASTVAAQMRQLQISLPEALRQVNTQRHPGAFLLLTCHLGKERPAGCQNFPWLSLGALLLLIGILCGPSRSDRPHGAAGAGGPVRVEVSEVRSAAQQVTVLPMLLVALCLCLCRHWRSDVGAATCLALGAVLAEKSTEPRPTVNSAESDRNIFSTENLE
ncbi:unnamed protein product, partial [Cladocopium goreaui]